MKIQRNRENIQRNIQRTIHTYKDKHDYTDKDTYQDKYA